MALYAEGMQQTLHQTLKAMTARHLESCERQLELQQRQHVDLKDALGGVTKEKRRQKIA